MELKIALLGFGNVNRAVARLILRKQAALQAEHDLTLRVVGISTNSHGRAIDPDGLDLQAALDAYATPDGLDSLHRGAPCPDTLTFVAQVPAELAVEATWMDPHTGQPALDTVRAALTRGRGRPRRCAIWDTQLEALDRSLPDTQLVVVGECWQHMLLEIHRVKA